MDLAFCLCNLPYLVYYLIYLHHLHLICWQIRHEVCKFHVCTLGWVKKSKILIWAFLFAGHLQNGVRDPPKKFQIYRPINDRWQAIFVLGSVLMGKRPKNGQKLTIFKNGLKTHPKVVNASNQRWFHHFWGKLDL